MIRALAAVGVWALTLMLACGLVIAPTMHGVMVACGREAFEVSDLVIAPSAFAAGVALWCRYPWLHLDGEG